MSMWAVAIVVLGMAAIALWSWIWLLREREQQLLATDRLTYLREKTCVRCALTQSDCVACAPLRDFHERSKGWRYFICPDCDAEIREPIDTAAGPSPSGIQQLYSHLRRGHRVTVYTYPQTATVEMNGKVSDDEVDEAIRSIQELLQRRRTTD